MMKQASYLSAVCLLLSMLGTGDVALAQAETPFVPQRSESIIVDGNLAGSGTSVPAVDAPLPVIDRNIKEEPETEAHRIRFPLLSPDSPTVLRLEGEEAYAAFSLIVPAAQIPTEIQIVYRAGINALPESSSLQLVVNGVPTDTKTVDAFDSFKELSFRTDALVAGENKIEVRSVLYHRIFCGPEASYALWLELDLLQSGAVVEDGSAVSTYAPSDASAWLLSQAIQGQGLTLRATPNADENIVAELQRQLSFLLPGRALRVDVQSVWEPISGDASANGRIIVDRGEEPLLELLRASDHATVMRIAHGTPNERSTGLPDLTALFPKLAADPLPPLLTPGEALTFAELGIPSLERRGHFVRYDQPFRLPLDWLILGPERVQLNLVYEYGSDLPLGSSLTVKVNNQNVSSVPFSVDEAAQASTSTIQFGASMLRSGQNLLTFEAFIPGDPPNAPCPIRTDPTLTISDETLIVVPDSPQIYWPGLEQVVPAFSVDDISKQMASAPSITSQKTESADASQADSVFKVTGLGNTTLTIVPYNARSQFPFSEYGLQRSDVEAVFPADEESSNQRLPAVEVGNLSKIGNEATGWIETAVRYFELLALPGDGPIKPWLSEKKGTVILAQPYRDRPQEIIMLLGPSQSMLDIGSIIYDAKRKGVGPSGQFSVLTENNTWQNWRSVWARPIILEPLSIANSREILSVYAAWAPILFVLVLIGLTAVSSIFAIIYVVRSRNWRQE